MKKIIFIIFLNCINYSYLFAQQGLMMQSNQMRLGAGIIRIAEPGQIADTVNVWGDIQNSGRFLIPKGTSLAQLISYAGGPVIFRAGDVLIDWSVIKLEIVVSRKGDYSKPNKFSFYYSESVPKNFSDYQLGNDDVIVVQIKRKRNWRDYLQVIGPIASTLTATILLYNLVRNTF